MELFLCTSLSNYLLPSSGNVYPLEIGNKMCDNKFNNTGCKYDGGACCPNYDLIGDGYCNDETNDGTCLFDGGDCCLSSANTRACSECGCSTTGVITSPGWGLKEVYERDIDTSWNIQVPSGQLIEIKAIYFDVGGHPELCE